MVDAPINPSAGTPDADARRARVGAIYALSAYGAWGLTPIYWRAIGTVTPLEIICHRALWSTLFVAGLIAIAGRAPELLATLRSKRRMAALAMSGALVMSNWYVYIWSVLHGYVLEASLGYYINPLVSVLLGVVFLRDRLGPMRIAAVALAVVAVAYLTWALGVAPWLALYLAVTFGLYGLIRKLVPVEPLVGLVVETGLAAPLALAWIAWAEANGSATFLAGGGSVRDLLLMGAGVITAVPLIWFAAAAGRLRLSTLGFFQYISPSIMFVLAIFAFGEALTMPHLIAFGMIWVALALYSVEAARAA